MGRLEQDGSPLILVEKLFNQGRLPTPFPSWMGCVQFDDATYNSELATTIHEDPRLTVAVLHYANSAIYADKRKFESVEDAILRLGYSRIKEILLTCFLDGFYHQQPTPKDMEATCRNIFNHSLTTAICCRELAPLINGNINPATAFTAGLLHHMGLHLLICRVERFYERIKFILQHGELKTWVDGEEAALGCNHAETGGLLLQLWELPESLQLAVWLHHDPPQGTLAEIVRISAIIANTPDSKKMDLQSRIVEELPRFQGVWWDDFQQPIDDLFESLSGLRGSLDRICPWI